MVVWSRRCPALVFVGVLFVGLFAQAHAEAQSKKKVVAVLPFKSPTRHSAYNAMGRNAQPTFITELVKSKKVRVVDEKRALSVVHRFAAEETGLFNPKKIRKIGRFLKADYIVSGQISYTGDAFTMTVHVTNIETLELEMAEDVDFRRAGKMRLAIRQSAKEIAALISGTTRKKGRHEAFLNINARHFYDTAEACIQALNGLGRWRYEGSIDEELDKRMVHVRLRHGRPKPGTPLQVFEEGLGENDRPIGVVYVVEPDESGGGFKAKWIKEKDKKKRKRGDFGLGARVSNARYRYRIALGPLVDEAEDNAQLIEMFGDKLVEKMEESERFIAKTGSRVEALAKDLGRGRSRKKRLRKLHKLGVDFILEGKFIGDPGRRRADFKVTSSMSGTLFGRLKFETRI